ncbi:hypothetical protein S83_028460, partial [Arachis hypogaea]
TSGAEANWESSHSLLCTGERSDPAHREALLKFNKHANEGREISDKGHEYDEFVRAAKLDNKPEIYTAYAIRILIYVFHKYASWKNYGVKTRNLSS